MARRLDSFDFVFEGGGETRYPWSEWLDGSIWELKHDKDFFSQPVSFRQHVYSRARVEGKKVRIADQGEGTFVIQAYEN